MTITAMTTVHSTTAAVADSGPRPVLLL